MRSDAAIRSCKKAGKVLLKYFWDSSLSPIDKGKGDLVTVADLESEKTIISTLKSEYPGYSIISEESGKIGNSSRYCWLIDPLDGTCNFVTGIPVFGVSVALLKDGKIQFYTAYLPVIDKLLYIDKDSIKINGQKTEKPDILPYHEHTVSMIAGYGEFDSQTRLIRKLSFDVKRVLTNWCPTMDFLLMAKGSLHTIITSKTEPLDLMPASLIADAYNMSLTDYEGNPVAPGLEEPFTGVLTHDKSILSLIKDKQ